MQRATQCQEKGSNHYPVTAKWGRLERRVRIEQAYSDPSLEYSPKIHAFLAQGLLQTAQLSFYSRVLNIFFFWELALFRTYIHFYMYSCAKTFCTLTTYQTTKKLSFALNFLPSVNFSCKWELYFKNRGSPAQHAVCTEMCAAWANGNYKTRDSPSLCFVHHKTKTPIPLQEEFPKSDSLCITMYKNLNPEI